MADPIATLELTRTIRDPARARALVSEQLADLPGSVVYDASLIVSELVTNVLVHGQLPARLEIHREPTPRVVVRDQGETFAYVRYTPSATSRSGRGLGIVAYLAKSWGITPGTDLLGKAIWAELNLTPDDL